MFDTLPPGSNGGLGPSVRWGGSNMGISRVRSLALVVVTALAATTAAVSAAGAANLAAPTVTVTADGTSWSCTFDDEFDGTTLDRTKWVPQTNFAGSLAQYSCFRDDPSNVSVADGAVTLTLLKLSQPQVCPTTGVSTDLMSGG